MTDYEEEQTNEIEALESIYSNEMTVISREPERIFELSLTTQLDKDGVTNATCVTKFTFPAKYPDELPIIEISDSENLTDEHITLLLDFMNQIAQENLGMVMVFTIISALQEKLVEVVENVADDIRNEKERREREIEEAEQKKFEGTKVSIETFLAWKTKFDAEMFELKRAKVKEESGAKKLTGKELFMLDHAMDDSDVKFLEEGEEVVEVDESLFQDIGDLDLEELDDGVLLNDDDDNES